MAQTASIPSRGVSRRGAIPQPVNVGMNGSRRSSERLRLAVREYHLPLVILSRRDLAKFREVLGLDDAPSRVIVSEHDVHARPNSGLAPVPRRRGVFGYHFIPLGLITQAKAKFVDLHRAGGAVRAFGRTARIRDSRRGSFPSSRWHAQLESV